MISRLADIVHIIPLGHEIDRVVRPFDTAKANRVYLLVDTGAGTSNGTSERDIIMQNEQVNTFTPTVIRLLEEKGITVHVVPTRTFYLEELLQTITSLIRLEKERGSEIQINMSGAGRLGAVAGFLAGIAYSIPSYYVRSDKFSSDDEKATHGMSFCSKNEVDYLPNFKYSIPDQTSSYILDLLHNEKSNGSNFGKYTPKQIVEWLDKKGVEGFTTTSQEEERLKNETKNLRTIESRKLMRLSTIMKKLTDEEKYVSLEREGRVITYHITDLGEHALSLTGMDKDKYAAMFPLK